MNQALIIFQVQLPECDYYDPEDLSTVAWVAVDFNPAVITSDILITVLGVHTHGDNGFKEIEFYTHGKSSAAYGIIFHSGVENNRKKTQKTYETNIFDVGILGCDRESHRYLLT